MTDKIDTWQKKTLETKMVRTIHTNVVKFL